MNSVRLALATVFALPVVLLAAPERPMAELLPESTIAYIELQAPTDKEQARAVVNRCLQEPRLRAVLDRMLSEGGNFNRVAIPLGAATLRIDGDIRESAATFDVHFRDGNGARSLRIRQNVTVALVSLGKRGAFGVDAVTALQFEGDAARAHATVRRLMAAISLRAFPRKGGTIDSEMTAVVTDYEHGGVKCAGVNLRHFQLHFATVGQRIVVASSRERLADVVDRSTKPAAKSLAQVTDFSETRKLARGDGTIVMQLHLNVQQAIESLERAYPKEMPQLAAQVKLLGFGGVRTFSSMTRVEGEGVAGTTSVLVDGHRVGLSRLFEETDPAKFGGLDFAPRDSYYAACGRFDVPSMFRVVQEVSGSIGFGMAMPLYQQFGINLQKDIIDVIGPEAAVIVSANRGVIPDVGLIFESRNAKALERTCLRVLTRMRWKQGTGVIPTRLAGGTAHVIRIFDADEFELPIAPTFGVIDGHFVVALFPVSYQRFAATKRGQRPSLEKNRDFSKLRGMVPANAQSISYMDLRRTIATLYDTFVPLLQALPQQGDAASIYELPDSAMFTDHLYGRIGWRVADKRGMHWYSHSSVDVGPLIGGVAAFSGAALAYTSTSVEEHRGQGGKGGKSGQTLSHPKPRRGIGGGLLVQGKRCDRNMRQLKVELKLFKKRRGDYPKSLAEATGKMFNVRTLQVPGHPGEQYRYFGPSGKNGILVAGYANGPDRSVCVITIDLVVKRVNPRDLRERLNRSPAGK